MKPIQIEEILRKDFSEKFVQAMKNRVVVSHFKYGPVSTAYPCKVAALMSAKHCIDQYDIDGNTEHLVDAANYLMFEFMLPSIEGAKYSPTDSGESVGRVDRKGRISELPNDRVGTNPKSITAEFR